MTGITAGAVGTGSIVMDSAGIRGPSGMTTSAVLPKNLAVVTARTIAAGYTGRIGWCRMVIRSGIGNPAGRCMAGHAVVNHRRLGMAFLAIQTLGNRLMMEGCRGAVMTGLTVIILSGKSTAMTISAGQR